MLDGNDLPHKLLLTTRQKAKLRNAFNNNMICNNSIWRIFRIIVKQISSSINESICSLAKTILVPLGITAAASAIDAGIQKIKKYTAQEQQL